MMNLFTLETQSPGGIERHTAAVADMVGRLGVELEVCSVNRAKAVDVARSLAKFNRSSTSNDVAIVDRVALAPYAVRRGSPYVLFLHGSEIASRSNRAVKRSFILRAAALISNSNWTTSRCWENFGRLPDLTLSPWVDVDAWSRPRGFDVDMARHRRGLRSASDQIVFIGRLDENASHKGLGRCIEALRSPRLDGVQLAVVGDGPLRERYETHAQVSGVAERVAFLGRLIDTDLREVLWSSDALVQPSLPAVSRRFTFVEGFGITFVEAAAAGVPVLGSIHGGAAEAVEPGVTGIRVDGSVASIVDGLGRILGGAGTDSDKRRDWVRSYSSDRGRTGVEQLLRLVETIRTA